jgi:hypothetical protein
MTKNNALRGEAARLNRHNIHNSSQQTNQTNDLEQQLGLRVTGKLS